VAGDKNITVAAIWIPRPWHEPAAVPARRTPGALSGRAASASKPAASSAALCAPDANPADAARRRSLGLAHELPGMHSAAVPTDDTLH